MKRALWVLPLMGLFLVWRLLAAYSYYHSEDLYPASWSYWNQLDGPLADVYSGGYSGLYSGALLTKSFGDAEVKITLRTNLACTCTFSAYHRVSTGSDPQSSLGGTPSGTMYWIRINATSGGQISINRVYSSVVTQVASTATSPVHDGVVIRSIVRTDPVTLNPEIVVYADNVQILNYLDDSSNMIGSGFVGIGGAALSDSAVISHVDLGAIDTIAPTAVSSGSIGKSPFANYVDLSWPATTDDASGTGVYNYEIWRGGVRMGSTLGTTFHDTAGIVPNTTYNYVLKAIDYHLSAASTAFSVTTPSVPFTGPLPSNIPEGRQVGVRPTGTYWGAGGENIDVRSGNVNYTLPLLAAKGRGSSGVGLNLTYNSQNWRQDSGGPWEFGKDVGYGFGWRLLAGSIEYVVADPFEGPVDYIFTDSTGAEYRLDQNNSNVWSSKSSIYVWFDANTNILHFRDGSFWYFGCVSASTEADGGTMYPTTIEDSNGNQVLINYQQSPGAGWVNSSARITTIEDVRAVNPGSGYQTYSFTYNTDTPPHLTSIANTIGTSEAYTLVYTSQALYSPITSASFGTSAMLDHVTANTVGTSNNFLYNSGGELTRVTLPYKGYLAYDYQTAVYPSSRSYREVVHRYLSKDGSTQTTYSFSHEASITTDVHQFTQLEDPGGVGEKHWVFATTGSSDGLMTQYQGRQLPGPVVKTQNDVTWTQDSTLNSYVATNQTTMDSAVSKTTQTVDIYGNVTQVNQYNYGNLSTPYRTQNLTYLGGSPYTSRYIFNRVTSATATDTTGTATLASVSYDGSVLATITGQREWDSAMATVTARGNPTSSTVPGTTAILTYDVAGNIATTQVNSGMSSTATTTSTYNYAAPSQITTGSFTNTMTYNSFLGLTNESGPNGFSVAFGFDTSARPASSTSPFGATTAVAYNDTATPAYATTTVNGGRWTKTTKDGLGRTILTETGYSTTTLSRAETVYGSCGCSPLGKMIQQAVPHAPGTGAAYTTYTYDGIGRTLSVQAADGASTTTYSYAGNFVTVTDPAGKSKTYTTDVLGQLVQVSEPNPGGGGGVNTPPWYGASWAKRKALTIDHTKVSGGAALTNFAVLLSRTDADLKTVANGGGVGKSDGTDILFTASDGVTKLDHELEGYTATTGQIAAWVRIQTLSNTADTTIYVYYGNASASDQQNKPGVWDSNYSLVMHFSNGSTLGSDSTANGNNGTLSANPPTATAGPVGNAVHFANTAGNGYPASYCPASSTTCQTIHNGSPVNWPSQGGPLSVEFWVNDSSPSVYQTVFQELDSGAANGDGAVYDGSGNLMWTHNGAFYQGFVTAPGAGSWHHIVYTTTDTGGSGRALYIDGANVGSYSSYADPTQGVANYDIGASPSYYFPFAGSLDELRFSKTARTAGWIATEFSNQNAPGAFYSSVGPVEAYAGGGGGGGPYVTTYTYDLLSHLVGVSMPRPTGPQTRTFNYGTPPGALLLSTTNPENGTVIYTYNSYQKVDTKTDAKGQQTRYTYDTYQRLTQVRHYISGTEDTCQQVNYSYDTNPYDGGTYSANISGRLAAVQYKNATTTPGLCDTTFQEWYSYDDGMTNKGGARTRKQLVVARTGVSGTVNLGATYMYDTEGRMTSQQHPDSYSLDTSGNPTVSLPGASLGYTYDSMGRLVTMMENGSTSVISSTTYGPAGELTAMSGAWGAESRSYNAMKQLTYLGSGITVGSSVSIAYNYSSLQNNGKITSQHDYLSGEDVTYTYDTLNRLASAAGSGWGLTYGYDGFGNLTAQYGTPYNIYTNYDATTNRVSGECSDLNGNVGGCYPNPSYSYDVENRIVANGPLMTVQYAYAPDNKRVWRSTWSSSTRILDEVAFWSVTGQRSATYKLVSYGGSLRPVQTGTEYYFGGKLVKNAGGYVYTDRLGSIGKYYPYGQDRSAPTNGTEKFGTYFRDADTGLDYADQRYHAPGQGRFLSPDPYQASGGPKDPGSWNRYSYVQGNPVNYTDRTGQSLEDPDEPFDPDPPQGPPLPIAHPDPPPHNQSPLPQPCDINGLKINMFIASMPIYGDPSLSKPLLGTGADFIAAALQYDVDPRILVAISFLESHWGYDQRNTGTNNAFGLKDAHGVIRFSSWSSSILAAARTVDNLYNGGNRSISDLYSGVPGAYCTDSFCPGAIQTIEGLVRSMGGDPNSLGFDCVMENGKLNKKL